MSAPTNVVAERREPPTTVRLEPSRGLGRLLSPADLWRYRDVATQIAARDIKVRYRQTALGALWAVLQPVGTMVVFTVVFGRLAGIPSGDTSYAVFSLAGIVPWTFFQNALILGADSLVSNAQLVSKVYFPRIFIPAGVVAAGLVDLAIAIVILLVVVVASGEGPSLGFVLAPLFVVMATATALGVASGLSAINVRYRDVRYIVPFASQLWLFATPVAYSSTLLDEPWRTLSAVNPMVGVVEGFRWATLGGTAPWALVGVSAVSAAAVVMGGFAYFNKVERSFADIV
jgi:lipopolysaccharide transport system permease protein